MSWTELRSVALVGTEKRQVGAAAPAVVPQDSSPEATALHHAALLGVQRLAGSTLVTAAAEPESHPIEVPPESNTPREATQLVELILGGNVVPASMQAPLLRHWLRACAAGGHVVPHRVLIRLLDSGAQSNELRAHLRPVLGHRGRWIAAMDERWAWAVAVTDGTGEVTTKEFESFGPEAKRQHLEARRAVDAEAAREFVGTVFTDLAATHRAACVESFETGLSHDDEPFLEACLDDGSKVVRAAAHSLLNSLPDSRRSQRMIERLAPLVSVEGRRRKKTVTVAWPDPPSKAEKNELSDRGSSIEASWLHAIVAGTPLSWWEELLELDPTRIVELGPQPQRELTIAWAVAATAQKSTPWADALATNGHLDPGTVDLASEDVLIRTIRSLHKADAAVIRRLTPILLDRKGPWSVAYGEALLAHFAKTDPKASPWSLFEVPFAERLEPQLAPRVEKLLSKAANDYEQRAIRRILQALTMQTSISTAFAEGATQ